MRARLVIFVMLLCSSAVFSQTLTTIETNGSSANRVDVLILGDGYTAAELGKFATDAQNVADKIFSQDPWKSYRKAFNIQRLDVASQESGASHPESSITKNTAFGAYYNCNGILRLICVDVGKVNSAIASIPANQRDLVVVLVNDTQYGGSGGFPAVASLHPDVIELVLHETGHSFALLTDEYGGPPPPACDASQEPSAANATKETDRAKIKWGAWIDASTPLPTTGTTNGIPGIYEGARYCDTGVYRPTYNSKMRSLNQPYHPINTEQFIRRYYNLVSPIDSSTPSATTVTLSQIQTQAFSLSTPALDTLKTNWLLDNAAVASGLTYTLNAATLPVGTHTLTATVKDQTAMVRSDPSGLLTKQRTWTINITCGYSLSAIAQSFPMAGGSGSVTVTGSCGAWTAVSNAPWLTITSGSSGSGNGTVAFQVASNTGSAVRTGTLTVAGQSITITQASSTTPLPVFTAAGVTNAASFVPGVTPGSIVTIFGTGLTAGVTGVILPTVVPLPTTLQGTSVQIGGVLAPIFALANVSGQEQINLQVPYEVTGQSSANIVVNNNGVPSAAIPVTILTAQPGIFNGAILHNATYQQVTASNPAVQGEVLLIYATGLGPVSPAPPTGALASGSTLAKCTITPVVTAGGVDMPVAFSGLAPGFAGLYQVNVTVPQNAPSGAVQLVISVGGANSKAVTVNLQ